MENNFVWTDALVERAIVWCLQYKEFLNMQMMKDEFSKGLDKKEVKKLLLTTEDRIDIYNESFLWQVRLYEGAHTSMWDIDKVYVVDVVLPTKDFKYFSTEEIANEYVLMNKPCLSVTDCLKIVRSINDGTNGRDNRSYLTSEFRELAKSKLK